MKNEECFQVRTLESFSYGNRIISWMGQLIPDMNIGYATSI